jgi:hypothetical protein
MSRRYFLGKQLENGDGYSSSMPGGMARKWGYVINGPLNASRMGLRGVERLNVAADMNAQARDPEYLAKTARFTNMFTSSAVPVGERWWAAGGARPIQPVLQEPGEPLPPLVDDN